jgi:outer membrane receptor protein involved in Fe transport
MNIKYCIYIFVLICIFSLKNNAQTNCIVKGTVIEKNARIEYANVFLVAVKDSTKIYKSTVSDSLGRFYLDKLIEQPYILKVQMIGYQPFRISIKFNDERQSIDLQNLEIITDGKIIDGVEIVSHKNLIQKTSQGFIINAKDNITQAGGTATDLLRNTPTVVVDMEGGITIRGKSPMILINGRNSSLASTDRIPASSIESIEIINNPSAQYDADAEGGIINIKLKKNTEKGTNGSVGLGAGYGAHGRVNSSFIINHQAGKWNFGLAYDNRFAGRTRQADANRTSFDVPLNYYLTQKRFDNRLEQTQNLKINIDFSPNEKNSFSFEAIGNLDGQDNDETLRSLFTTQSDSFNTKNSRESIEIGREKVAEFALNYQRKFAEKRKKLSMDVSTSFNYETENTNISTQSLNATDNQIGNPFLQQTSNYQNSNVSNLKIDFTQPLSLRSLLDIGYKGITNADFKNKSYVNNEYITNASLSNIFNFNEQIHAAYIQYRSYIGKIDSAKLKYDIGLRAEEVINEGKGLTNAINVSRQYFNLFPSANVAYYVNSTDFFKLGFNRRINRPGLGQLNPFTDITDSLNQHGGNPYLKPELVNALELGYNKEWKKISFTTNVFYRYSTNIIRNYIILNPNGVALTLPMNFGNSTTYGIESIISLFPTSFWSANVSASAYQQQIDGSNINSDVANNLFSWYGKITNNLTLWKGSKMQITVSYNAPVGTPQGQKVAIYYGDFGFQQKVFKGKGGLGLVITDVFNTQANGLKAYASNFSYSRKFKIDTRAILLTFAYSFGTKFKEEALENKFSND